MDRLNHSSWIEAVYYLVLLIFLSWQFDSQSEEVERQLSLYEIVEARAKDTGNPSISAGGVTKLTDEYRKQYIGVKPIHWSTVNKLNVLHLDDEDIESLKVIAENNVDTLFSSRLKNKPFKGKVSMQQAGTSGWILSSMLSRYCSVKVIWKVKKKIRITLDTGVEPIETKYSCEIMAWLFAVNGVKFSNSDEEANTLILSDN